MAEVLDLDESARFESPFNDSEDEGEFLGFTGDEVRQNLGDCSVGSTDAVKLYNINEDSNSKTSGYGTSDKELTSESEDSDVPSDSEDEFSCRLNREKAVADRKNLLKNLMSDLRSDAVFNQMITTTPNVRRTTSPSKRPQRRHFYLSRSLPPVTRRRSKLGDPNYIPEEESDDEDAPRSRLLVRFGPKRKFPDAESESSPPRKRVYSRRSAMAQEHFIIKVEDVTDEMLQKIAQHSVGKEYNTAIGTSCHQCRQKTMDTKSCCRNKSCVGVRGQFCGPCLQNRYGESVRDALLDPDWSCPVCRGFCNCSICRNREGKCATGILIGLAKYNGYTNVKDYLAGLKTEKDFVAEE